MPPELNYDLAKIDFANIVVDQEGIRACNPQRFEMEHLNAIVHEDVPNNIVIGYKDVRFDEFWIRGHMPGYPLLPGVLLCEASAQLCSCYCKRQHVVEGDFIGFAGMENVRFRAPVVPGDRLVLVAKGLKINRRQMHFNVQGFVKNVMVFHGDVIGLPLSRKTEA